MADYNNANTTFFKPSTDGMVMFSDTHMLKISYYDTTMRFEIRAKNADGKYPSPEKGKEISVLLNAENVAKLNIMLDVFDKKLDEYNSDFVEGKDCSDYKPYSISIFTGATPEASRIFQISTGTVGDNGFTPEVWIHIGVDENRVALSSSCYKTRTTPVLINYDAKSGDVEMLQRMGQYQLIDASIRNFVDVANKAGCHFNKTVVNDEKLNKMENLIKLIADHFNIYLPDNDSNGYNYNRGNSPFDSFNSNNVAPPVVENGGDLGTLLGSPNYR